MVGPKRGTKGYDMEESLKAYFWQAGYFVVRGLPYQIDGEDVTDVDLWLYERPAASTRRRIIVDIKNKRSPKAAERIIWTKGLQAALGVEGAIVATTDGRSSMRRLGRGLSLQVLDGEALTKIGQSDKIELSSQQSLEVLNEAVRTTDENRRSGDWRSALHESRASLVSGFGVQSTNLNLATSAFFAGQAIAAQPKSDQAMLGVRLMYLTSAFAAISLDYVLADQAFRSPDERRSIIVNAIRFGQSELQPSLPMVKAAVNLARKYAESGHAVAKQIEIGFHEEASRIPAEFIADYLAKISRAETLFNAARELERASSLIDLPSFDSLSNDARSVLGVFLDFNGISREKIALAWPLRVKRAASEHNIAGDLGLFGKEKNEE